MLSKLKKKNLKNKLFNRKLKRVRRVKRVKNKLNNKKFLILVIQKAH